MTFDRETRSDEMALPRAVDAAKVQAVSEALGKMSPQEIGALPPLDDEDLRLFGAISQHYCFLDLNLRRAIEIMHMAKRLPPPHISKIIPVTLTLH